MTVNRRCPDCGHDERFPLTTYHDEHGTVVHAFRCEMCGSHWIQDSLPAPDLGRNDAS